MVIDFALTGTVTLLHYSFKKLGGIMKTTLLSVLLFLLHLFQTGSGVILTYLYPENIWVVRHWKQSLFCRRQQ